MRLGEMIDCWTGGAGDRGRSVNCLYHIGL